MRLRLRQHRRHIGRAGAVATANSVVAQQLDETLDSNRDQNGASRRDGFDTDDEARRFLAGVAVRLGSETPPIKFAWAGVSDHLRTDALWMLVERIADASEFVAPNEKSKEPNDKPKG